MLQKRIESLIKLGEELTFNNDEFALIAKRAEVENPWFTREFIQLAVESIRDEFLNKEKLTQFAEQYELAEKPKKVGIVLAGNIPLVGFHDILCGVLSGHYLQIKVSSKDKALINFVIDKLKSFDEEINDKIEICERLNNCDAYIATGSNQSNVYFEQYFGKYPNILRKSRSSVAILTGHETKEELEALGKDIHYFFGLGCRNVSKIYVPYSYNFEPLIKSFEQFDYLENEHKYKNNYDYNLSLLLLNQQMYMSSKSILVVEKEGTHAPISVLHYEFYSDEKNVLNSIEGNSEIQAIVGVNHIPFGEAQKPSLNEFADGIDTMQFLSDL